MTPQDKLSCKKPKTSISQASLEDQQTDYLSLHFALSGLFLESAVPSCVHRRSQNCRNNSIEGYKEFFKIRNAWIRDLILNYISFLKKFQTLKKMGLDMKYV